MEVELVILRVFVSPAGTGGNPLAVFLEGERVPPAVRQHVATDIGLSETVFVDDIDEGQVEIYTPRTQLPFAGHPLVGTSWLLNHRGHPTRVLRAPAGEVPTWMEGDKVWIRARPEWSPEMEILRLDKPELVEELTQAPPSTDFLYAWAWRDKSAGNVRARAFAPGIGIPEDEASGAAVVRLTHTLGRPVRVFQGQGSVLYGQPGPGGTVEVGGLVAQSGIRPYRLP